MKWIGADGTMIANVFVCHRCRRQGTFASDGFDFVRVAGSDEPQPVCGKCSRREFSVGALPVVLRKYERSAK